MTLAPVMLSACGGGGGTSPPPQTERLAPPEPMPQTEPPPQTERLSPPERLAPPEPMPLTERPPPEPTPQMARAADDTARTHVELTSSEYRPASHPLGAGRTSYRAETLEPSTNPRTASSWETAEYNAQAGLGLIRASTGYAARNTGRPGGGGITIAIVDQRIPVDDDKSFGHPDLEGVRLKRVLPDHAVVDDEDHGTLVAGIAAARRNGYAIHGVAYNANIVSVPKGKGVSEDWHLEAILASIAGLKRGYYTISGEIHVSNPEASAHVANLSLLEDTTYADPIARGMKLMARENRVMVAALGNDGERSPPYPPASKVADEGIAGYAIAVGALNSSGTAAARWPDNASSNWCGNVKRYCLFAPGEGLRTTSGRYSNISRGQRSSGGTSLAAPHVSGAVAAVWAAFPNKTGNQIVERILSTARQVDTANGNYDSDGLSVIYGHGALDLGAAMNPVGFTSLQARNSGLIPVRRSFVSLPPGFRHRPTATLRDAIVYDTQMFPFLHDLNGAIRTHRTNSATSALDDFLSPPGYVWSSERLGQRTRVEFAWPRQGTRELSKDMRSEEIRNYRFRVEAASALSLQFGPRGASSDFVASRLGRGLFRDGFVVEPLTKFTGDGMALGVNWRPDEHTWLDFTSKTGSGYFGGGRTRFASFGVTRRFGADLMLRVRYGALRERGSSLGIRGSGAFRDASGARTDSLGLGVESRLASGAVLFGSLDQGMTKNDAAGADSLVSGWKGGRGESFALGGEWSELWRDADRLTLSASSPFRPRSAGMYVDVPDRELADGVVAYARHWVNLSPRGREVRLQAVYEADAAPGAALSLGSFLRLNPDHDPKAPPEFGVAAKLRMNF